MESVLLDGGEDAEHIGVGYVETSRIFLMQDAFFSGMYPFDAVNEH